MKKNYRINIIVSYYEGVNVNQYRQPIISILTNFAWLYRLEYAISTSHNFGLDDGDADLIYFRSTKDTKVSKKEFDSIILNVFRNGLSMWQEGVDVGRQFYKVLPQYPFPDEYCKPLNYPYMEVHNGKEVTLCICAESLQNLPTDEDFQDSDTLPS